MKVITYNAQGLPRIHEAGRPTISVDVDIYQGWRPAAPVNRVESTPLTSNRADGLIVTRYEGNAQTGECVVHPCRFRPSLGPADEGAPEWAIEALVIAGYAN